MSQDNLTIRVLKPALEYVARCPVDSKIIQDSAQTLRCPSCGVQFCMFPCAEKLASKKKKCPTCRKFEMSQLTEILQNSRHLLRLEELKDVGRVSASVYEKLRLEYEAKNQDAIAEVYSGSVSQDKLQREVAIKCTTCGKKASYIAEYERWYCYKCKKYQPKPKAETGQQVP